jgi:hypothetical protein
LSHWKHIVGLRKSIYRTMKQGDKMEKVRLTAKVKKAG